MSENPWFLGIFAQFSNGQNSAILGPILLKIDVSKQHRHVLNMDMPTDTAMGKEIAK